METLNDKLRKKKKLQELQKMATPANKSTQNQQTFSNSDDYRKLNMTTERVKLKFNQIMRDTQRTAQNFGYGVSSSFKNAMSYLDASTNKWSEGYRQQNAMQNRIKQQEEMRNPKATNSQQPLNIDIRNNQKGTANLIDKKDTTSVIGKAIEKEVVKDEQKIQQNIETAETKVGKKLAELAPSMAQSTTGMALGTVNPYLGLAYFQSSAGGAYTREAKAKGMNDEQAYTYGTIMGALESATEYVGNKLTIGVGKKFFGEGIEEGFKAFGLDVAENALEEAVMEPLSEYVTQLTGGQANWDNMGQRILEAGFNGALSSIIMGGVSAGVGSATKLIDKIQNGERVTQEEIAQTLKDINKSEEVDIEKLLVDSFKFTADDLLLNTTARDRVYSKLDSMASDISKNEYNAFKPMSDEEYEQAITKNKEFLKQRQQVALPYTEKAKNQFSQEFEGSAQKYGIDVDNYSVKLAKEFTDRANLQLVFEETTEKNALAVYKDGKVIINANAIKNNPDKVIQNIVLHESLHGKSGSKEFADLTKTVLGFVESKGEYKKARADLEGIYGKAYKGRPDFNALIDEEVVTNTLGEYFGTEEKLNELINYIDDRTTLQKLYDFVKDIVNSLTGYKDQEQYFRRVERQLAKALQSDYVAKSGDRFSIQREASNESNVNIKQKQLEIILKSNPMHDDYHTGIRSIEDIKTYQEALNDDLDGEIQDLTPDFKADELRKALETGEITVYSSYPIEQGVFVTPSKMEAGSYAGNINKVYSKKIKLSDVAWIDSLQGQYAKVEDANIVTDDKGNALELYHGTPYKGDIEEFDVGLAGSNTMSDFDGIYFTDNKDVAEDFSYQQLEGNSNLTYKRGEKGQVITANLKSKKTLDLNKLTDADIDNLKPYLDKNKTVDGAEFALDLMKQMNKYKNAQGVKFYLDMKALQDAGYDMLIADMGGNYKGSNEYIVFNKNQIKKKDNTQNIVTDSKGRTLSKEQQAYFKDSKVRDENGNLLEVYHGTKNSDFTIFDKKRFNTNEPRGDYVGEGFFFHNDINKAKSYGNEIKKAYLNIKNPLIINNEQDGEKFREQFDALYNPIDETEKKFKTMIPGYSYFALMEQNPSIIREYLEQQGYDGLIDNDYGQYAVFNSNQIKNVDNLNPTDNPDIRYSLSQDTRKNIEAKIDRYSRIVEEMQQEGKNSDEWAPYANEILRLQDQLEETRYSYQSNGEWQKFVEKYFSNEGTKTKLGDIKLPTKAVTMKDFNSLLDNAINIPKADKKALKSELKGVKLTSESLKEFEETVKAMDNLYKEESNRILNQTKSFEEIRPNYNKYMKYNTDYDKGALEKAKQTVPTNKQGRRTKDQWLNVAKQIGIEIANKTNQEIEEIAYRTWQDERPNQKSSLNRQGEKFVKFDANEWINTIFNTVKEQRAKLSIDTNKMLEQQPKKALPEKNVLQENTSNLKQTTTKKETDTEIAKVLNTPVTRQKPQDRKWAIFKASVFDKGIVFEDLSKRAKNRELEAKWDYTLSSSARAQYAIGNARLDENGNKISKGLTEIIDEVGDKIDDFQNYMYHLLNIDRMSLKERFGIDNKPVFGKNIGKDYSERKVEEFEKANPKFKEWAQDVYDYANADKAELVKNGVISQELSDKFAEMYPHYVPIQRANKLGNAINLPLDTRRTSVNTPIKQAKGGSSDLNPLFETLAGRTMQTYRASARNSLGVELKNTLETLDSLNSNVNDAESLDSIMDTMADEKSTSDLLQASKDGKLPTFTVFENGNKVTFDISEDIYDALKPVSKALQGNYLWGIPHKLSNLRRAVLTEYNPLFSITNTVKDTQDVLMNSQHAYKTYKKYPEAYWQIMRNGYWKQEYIQNGGEQNTYFKDGEFEKVTKKGLLKQVVTFPLDAISKVNGALEMAPRLAEYIASREEGKSIQTSMLDASRVTTNFKAGGDVTKALNRNGFTFLNAGVQGAMQAVRNVREANVKGLKGWTMLACKMAVAGAPVLILNNLMWEDDDDYEQLQDYVKDGYYIIGKRNDGTFVRIPKGRTLAVIQKVVSNVDKYINNEGSLNIDEVSKDFWETAKFTIENLAPSNPLDNNVISPIIQSITNTSWYGEDIVPSRLQNVPNAEQFDETTDKFSKWLGEKTSVSPMKINYLLDQYGGGVSDILLPLGTPQAENTPLEDKFVTDPVMKSKYPGEFFEKSDELTKSSNSMYATDTDIVKGKYMSYIQSNLSDLYKEKREIQSSIATDEEKKRQLKEIQKQINETARMALEEVEKPKMTKTTALIGNEEFYKNSDGEWERLKDKDKISDVTMKSYSDYKIKKEQATDKKRKEKNNDKATLNDAEIITIIKESNYTDKEKDALFDDQINDKTYKHLKLLNNNDITKINQYMDYKTADLESNRVYDGTKKGKAVTGSAKNKLTTYLNNSSFNGVERLYLYGQNYKLNSTQRAQLQNYVKKLELTPQEEKEIWLDLSSSNVVEMSDGSVRWK